MKYYVEYLIRKRGTKNPALVYNEYDIISDISEETIAKMKQYWLQRGFEILWFTDCEDYYE